jgi:hypothetical protein
MQFVAKPFDVRGRRITMPTSSTTPEEPDMNRFSTSARRQLLLAAGALALAAPLSASAFGFGGETVHGSGNITKQARQLQHFTGVELSVPGNVELHVGASEGLTIETDANLLPLIETVVDQGVLRIRPVRERLNLETRTLRITVNARDIERLSVAGAGAIEADALRARKLTMSLAGSGSVKARSVEADELAVQLAGNGDLSVGGGAVGKLKVSLAGSGDVKLGKLKAGEVGVNTAGSGDTTVWASSALDVSLVGSGSVNYYGNPQVSRSRIGSGDVRRAEGAPR